MDNGLITNNTKSVFIQSNKIQLKPNLFDADALIFKDIKSRKITLKHNIKGNVLSLRFNDFPYLGIWAKPNAPYVCIEPWIGLADSENTNQQLTDKEGIVKLAVGSTFKASYSIEIDESHLD
jgi:galactose mutarotase-like enzyme